MKVFISQPMKGIAQEKIDKRREEIIQAINNRYLNENIEFIYSIITEYPNEDIESVPVWYLGKSVEKLSQATLAYFDEGWEDTRGCVIEHMICEKYKIKTIDYINLFTCEKE